MSHFPRLDDLWGDQTHTIGGNGKAIGGSLKLRINGRECGDAQQVPLRKFMPVDRDLWCLPLRCIVELQTTS